MAFRRQMAAAVAGMAVMAGVYGLTLRDSPHVQPVSAAEQQVQTVELEPMTVYFVQLAACETAQEARITAARTVQRGSAGAVVLRDGRFCVYAKMESSQEAAETAVRQLKSQGIDAECVPEAMPTVQMRVTASPTQLRALNDALHALDMACVQPGEIAERLEAKEIDAASARGMAAMLAGDLKAAEAAFRATGAEGRLADSLLNALTQARAELEPLTADDGGTRLMLSGRLRHAGIRILLLRKGIAEFSA